LTKITVDLDTIEIKASKQEETIYLFLMGPCFNGFIQWSKVLICGSGLNAWSWCKPPLSKFNKFMDEARKT